MSNQNSGVEHQIRPEQLREELGIGKDAYYAYLKQLGIKAERGKDGKSYLTPEQANLVRQIRHHVLMGGKIAEFAISNSLSVREDEALAEAPPEEAEDPTGHLDMDALMREAAELAAHRMAYVDEVKRQIAANMTYEDLPEDIKAQVDSVRRAAVPSEPPGKLAADLLSRWRQRRQGQNQVQAA